MFAMFSRFAHLLRSPRLHRAAGLFAGLGTAAAAQCHGNHSHDRVAELEQRLAALEARYPRSQTTGQNGAVFSWSVELTDAFPEAARPFEKDMHGGFNEDADTGVVYTGIPGYGLCAISPDLKQWTRLGTDSRLKANIHGLVVFKHGAVKRLALAQNDAQRVLIVDLEGTVLQELGPPVGGEFSFDEANGYYSSRPSMHDRELRRLGQHRPDFKCTDVTRRSLRSQKAGAGLGRRRLRPRCVRPRAARARHAAPPHGPAVGPWACGSDPPAADGEPPSSGHNLGQAPAGTSTAGCTWSPGTARETSC